MLVGLVPTFSRVLVLRLRIPHLDLSRLEFLFLVQFLEYSLVFDLVCSQSQLFWCQNQKQESCASLTLFLPQFCLYCRLHFSIFILLYLCLSLGMMFLLLCGCCTLHLEDGLVTDGDVAGDDDGVGVPVGAAELYFC